MQKARKLLSIFMLLSFVLCNMTSLHVLDHGSDQELVESCDWCEFALETQQAELFVPAILQSPATDSLVVAPVLNTQYRSPNIPDFGTNHYFSRPPPQYTS